MEGVTCDGTEVKMLLSLLKQVILGEATVTTMTGLLRDRMTAQDFDQDCVTLSAPDAAFAFSN